jgi:hypothetical protein
VGIRQSQGKNKKSKRRASAVAVKREETVRRAARDTGKGLRSRPTPRRDVL